MSLIQWIPETRRSDSLVERRYHAGDRIFAQGEATTERVGTDGTLTTTTGVWVPGNLVGMAGLWDRSGYPASARSIESPTVMGWIARDVVLRLHQEIPQFGLEISRLLSERLRFVQESVSNRQGRPMINQVASVLVTLSRRMGSPIALTHEDLAHIIGTHRETVSRALQELTRQGLIRSHHGTIDIVALDHLENWTLAGGS